MDLDEIFIKCLKWDKEQSVKITISMLMVGFQSPGIILWSRHSVGGLSCLGRGLCSLSALVEILSGNEKNLKLNISMLLVAVLRSPYYRAHLEDQLHLHAKFE